ncbi:MAG: FAD:protein FMN transferase [Lachnospiraceae bacterium]|nr:FAD:protein FMN transferase [Lachnospiraceae bacterium]
MKQKVYIARLWCLCLLFFTLIPGCKRASDPITKTSFKLNTVVTITIYDSQDTSLLDSALELCDYYENLFSRTRETSEIYRVNQGSLSELSGETKELIELALSYASRSEGAFDPSIGPVSSLWNWGSDEPRVPDSVEIQEKLPLVNYQKVELSGDTLSFAEEGMMLDLGAVAKGYIADRMKEYLKEQGVTSATIDLGGNILCIGARPDGSPFRIGIRQPFASQTTTIGNVLEITDQSVVTSGIYERYFEQDGILYHHLLDPSTGYPCENDLASVTIISAHSADGDALSTSCYLLGLDRGLDLVDSIDGTYAVFITKENQVIYSEGFQDAFQMPGAQ